MSRWRLGAFALVCVAQLAVPASLIAKHEQTRASGTPWRFQTAPVDPADPFRGRYVQLAFAVDREPVPLADATYAWVDQGQRVYAELAAGPDGYARLVRVHAQRPPGVAYIDAFVQHMHVEVQRVKDGSEPPPGPPSVMLRMPFDRYYLPEARAPEVERAYWDASRKAQANTWAEVRVRDGHAVLTALVLDGQPVD